MPGIRMLVSVAALSCLLFTLAVSAQPNLATSRVVQEVTVFDDLNDSGIHYYVPGKLHLAERDGRPEFDFLLTRYTGTALRGHQGETTFFGQITMQVESKPHSASQLAALRGYFASSKADKIDLRPLPLSSVEGKLIYAPLASPADSAELGLLQASGAAADRPKSAWLNRTFTVRLNEPTSELFWERLREGKLIMSFAYAYLAEGMERQSETAYTSSTLDPDSVSKAFAVEQAPVRPVEKAVLADAFSIVLDYREHPDHFTRVDFNSDRVPPGYPALSIRCYDFRDELRDDLWEKQVVVEAESVSGRPSRVKAVFSVTDPGHYKEEIRFPFSVRLDEPFRYRVTEVGIDGRKAVGEWIVAESWIKPLDITTPYDELLSLRAQDQEEDPE